MLNIVIFITLCLIWGSTWLAIKIGLEGSPPFLAAGYRFLLAAAFLGLFSLIFQRHGFNFKGKWPYVFLAGLFTYPLSYGLVYLGTQHVESGMAAVLFAIMPFFVAILAHYFVPGEKLTLTKIFGMVIGFIGIVVIFAENLSFRGSHILWGMMAIVASSFCSSSGSIIMKKHLKNLRPVPLTTLQTGIGGILLLAPGLLFESPDDFSYNIRTLGSLVYLGILGTAVTFSLYLYLLHKMEVTKLSTIAFITPVIAVILGIAYRHETMNWAGIVGSAMVLFGVIIVISGTNFLTRRPER